MCPIVKNIAELLKGLLPSSFTLTNTHNRDIKWLHFTHYFFLHSVRHTLISSVGEKKKTLLLFYYSINQSSAAYKLVNLEGYEKFTVGFLAF